MTIVIDIDQLLVILTKVIISSNSCHWLRHSQCYLRDNTEEVFFKLIYFNDLIWKTSDMALSSDVVDLTKSGVSYILDS